MSSPVGDGPTQELADVAAVAGAQPGRRRRLAVLGAAGATLAVVGAVTALSLSAGPGPTPSADGPEARTPVGDDARYFGAGHVGIDVPDDWAVNAFRCATPTENTVIVGVEVFAACDHPRPAGVSDVTIHETSQMPYGPTDEVLIGGQVALASQVECTLQRGPVCRQAVLVPGEQTLFVVTSPDRDLVQRFVGSIRLLDDHAQIPPPRNQGAGQYAARLRSAGFIVTTKTEETQEAREGTTLDVEPLPGRMVPTGFPVTITVAERPDGDPATDPGDDQDRDGPEGLTCPTEQRSSGTVSYVSEPPTDPAPQEAARTWAGGEISARTQVAYEADDRAVVFLVGSNGTAHTALEVRRMQDSGWFVNTVISCVDDPTKYSR